jgi:hypothetical protein
MDVGSITELGNAANYFSYDLHSAEALVFVHCRDVLS